jgi:hypothetical protein
MGPKVCDFQVGPGGETLGSVNVQLADGSHTVDHSRIDRRELRNREAIPCSPI